MSYTFVTVCHKADYPLLRLQARSVRRFLPDGLRHQIYVIANQGLETCNDWQNDLVADYGSFAERVRFLPASAIAPMPRETPGWTSQQILKLMVAQLVTTDHYVVLDAKNHLVFPLADSFLLTRTGVRAPAINYDGHPMRHSLESALRYFDVADQSLVSRFLPTVTPFVLPTRLVRTLIETVTSWEKKAFPTAFMGLGGTEFLLFGAFLASLPGGIDTIYEFQGSQCPAIWPKTARAGFSHVAEAVARVARERLPFFTLHREAIPNLDGRSRDAVGKMWFSRRLFDTTEQGIRFIESFPLADTPPGETVAAQRVRSSGRRSTE